MVAILQSIVPDYRSAFFSKIQEKCEVEIFCYEDEQSLKSNNFHGSIVKTSSIKRFKFKNFIVVNPFTLWNKKYDTLVLMLTPYHIISWFFLITKFIHKKKIILWGHGISISGFLVEERKVSFLKKWLIVLSDEVWFYTNNELELWKKRLPTINAISLNNTISSVTDIMNRPPLDKEKLKYKYGIKERIAIIYCARFNEEGRRVDLLEKLISMTCNQDIAYIIIGDGLLKPNFSKYPAVRDFGAIYDQKIKNELFQLADIYFQPGWVGLSIVEAMAYGKPIFTLKRSKNIPQCVEYSYIINGYNGYLFDSVEDVYQKIVSIDSTSIQKLSCNCRRFVYNFLTIDGMITRALDSLKEK
ncbi:glycosyltransferase [Spirosoma luteum]|uniref:glycosyltransferase n=1 Tax=Spirosoma luteum TaxID=431553 RepID=UPI00037E2F4B|nr:glycosyltransferase [Spirosoma luteum]